MKDKNGNFFERNPFKTLIVVLLVSFVIIDFSAGSIYMLIKGHGFFEEPSAMASRFERPYRVKSDIYHHDLAKKFYIQNAYWGSIKYPISTDSLGFKNKEVRNIPLSSDMKRILFIGDSFTEGVGVEYQRTFVGIISRKLEQYNVEVLNAGVVSYSPIIYWRKIKYLIEDVGLKFDELVVFIDISDIQDEAIYYRLSKTGAVEGFGDLKPPNNAIKDFITNYSILSYATLNYIHDLIISTVDDSEHAERPLYDNYQRAMWTVDENVFEEIGEKGLKKSEHYMDLLAELARKHDIKLTVAVYPWPEQIKHNDLNSVQVDFWKEWATERDVVFLNYFPCFIELDNTEIENSKTIANNFILGDVHWSSAGHNLIAMNFLSFYRSNDSENDDTCFETV